jgi:uncharacterized membrane protein YbhN (UPF0104 family)
MSRVAETGERKHRGWTRAFSILLAGLLLYLAVRGDDFAKVGRIIAGARWKFVVAGTGFTCCALWLRSLRWRILLNAEASLDVATVFYANMAGNLGNTFLPARAGEMVRSVLISTRSSLSKTYVLTTAVTERLMDAIALVLTSSLALWDLNPKPEWMAGASRIMGLAGLAGVFATIVLPHSAPLWGPFIRRLPLPEAIGGPVERIVEQVVSGLRSFHNRRRLSKFALLTAAVWLSDAGATVIGGRAFGLHISFPVAMLLLTGLGLGSAVPATPGSVGIYQFIYVSVLTLFGIGRAGALAFALFSQVMGCAVTLAIGIPSLYQLQRRPPGCQSPGVTNSGALQNAALRDLGV